MRKPIDKKNCIEVGYLKKTHGVKGAIQVIFHDDMVDEPENLEFLFFEIDGLLVPFFVEEVSGASANILKFQLINQKEKASAYLGCNVFLDKSDVSLNEDVINPSILVGFTLFDQNDQRIGEINEVNDFGGNLVLSVDYNGEEKLIPYNDELAVAFDLENMTIGLNCPEGIFDMDEE